ncbi:MAG TPA: serine hydroxymethyltransferase [Planctomycetota bacterium]|nr:serine hydroxymethyltransferase [Planctomycetota bacterium]
MPSKLIAQNLRQADPFVADLLAAEDRRQAEKLVMIASESITPPAVRAALDSSLSSIYAEGYPHPRMARSPEGHLADVEGWLAHYRRYSGKRYYKGVEFADFVESLAIRRTAEVFATEDYPPERLFVNVQPLSGAAANNAVYEAFLAPGDTVMGMELSGGGHLTHGSPVNRSGKRYRVVSYRMDPTSGRLDYEAMKELAAAEKPKLLIAGYSAYPWSVDWKKLREVAEAAGTGCILLADVAHTAGLIAAGCYPNPVGIAHAVSFTTHKSLCGPRSAVLISTDPEVAKKLDAAVFPGEQGGPHMNTIAAVAVAMRLAKTEAFRNLMERVVENAAALGEALAARGLKLAYGGTDTHLVLVDLKSLTKPGEPPLSGEIASRILDLAGIVCNKNTVIGDENAFHPSGVRFGTVWLSQRGLGAEDMDALAEVVASVLKGIKSFAYAGTANPIGRGKIEPAVLETARAGVRKLLAKAVRYPETATAAAAAGDFIEVRGERARVLLHEAGTANVLEVPAGKAVTSRFLDAEGQTLAVAVLAEAAPDRWLAAAGKGTAALAAHLRDLSDGYVFFDHAADIGAKVAGPARVALVSDQALAGLAKETAAALRDAAKTTPVEREAGAGLEKPYFAGIKALRAAAGAAPKREIWKWTPAELPLRRTCLHEEHKKIKGARLVPFAGWEMPVWYTSISEEHRAVRTAAGIFDVAHMGVLEVRGPGACRFLDLATSNYVPKIDPGTAAYAYLLGPDGVPIDDILIYCIGREKYMVIVNACNAEQDFAWLKALSTGAGRWQLDLADPWARLDAVAEVRDLKAPEAGAERRVDVSIQGPRSRDVLLKLADSPADARRIGYLLRNDFAPVKLAGIPMYVSRTGYTGESLGYECYLHPDGAARLWGAVLEAGRPLGLVPCGLGSRDSTRTEAGLPLFGHELAGKHRISPAGAGYGSFVKLHKPFFAGRASYLAAEAGRKSQIVRFRLNESGARSIQPGDPVASSRGEVVGEVTSCVLAGDRQVGMAYVTNAAAKPGTKIGIFPLPRLGKPAPAEKARDKAAVGDKTILPEYATVLSRFRDARGEDEE